MRAWLGGWRSAELGGRLEHSNQPEVSELLCRAVARWRRVQALVITPYDEARVDHAGHIATAGEDEANEEVRAAVLPALCASERRQRV